MSTKVWTAYRLKKGVDLWDFACDVRQKAQKRCRAKLKEVITFHLERATQDEVLKARVFNSYYGPGWENMQPPPRLGPYAVGNWIRKGFREQTIKGEKDLLDLDVCVVFRKYKGRWLVVPYSGSGFFGKVLDFLKRDKRLEDYHYQNQSDKSARCSDAEWKARGEAWDYVLEEERFDDKLVIEISTHGGFSRIDPSTEMAIAAKAKEQAKEKV